MALAAVAVGAAYSHTLNTECEAATASWSSAPSDAAAAAAAPAAPPPVRNPKLPTTRQHNMMQPRNVMLHRMRSVRGRNLEDKYNVDWSLKLGEGAYGSVYPARLATTGEKVSLVCNGTCSPSRNICNDMFKNGTYWSRRSLKGQY
jgi:hypothetical protein